MCHGGRDRRKDHSFRLQSTLHPEKPSALLCLFHPKSRHFKTHLQSDVFLPQRPLPPSSPTHTPFSSTDMPFNSNTSLSPLTFFPVRRHSVTASFFMLSRQCNKPHVVRSWAPMSVRVLSKLLRMEHYAAVEVLKKNKIKQEAAKHIIFT